MDNDKLTKNAEAKITYTEGMALIDAARARLKKDKTMQEVFKKYHLDINEIDYIVICFAKIDVSARTDHGIIYLNEDLAKDGKFENNDHYVVHEITHFCQQTTGDGPTEGSTDETYLDNKYEQEGFKMQTEYLSETQGDETAEKYIDQVLQHHDVPKQEQKKRKKELLQLASLMIKNSR